VPAKDQIHSHPSSVGAGRRKSQAGVQIESENIRNYTRFGVHTHGAEKVQNKTQDREVSLLKPRTLLFFFVFALVIRRVAPTSADRSPHQDQNKGSYPLCDSGLL
jgi:hypothetical protein